MSIDSTGGPAADESSFGDPGTHALLDVDRTLRALAHPCRREVLCHLDARAEWDLGELARQLGSVPALATGASDRTSEATLHHQHLPCLADAGLVVIEQGGERVSRGRNFALVREMVDAAVDRTDGPAR